MAMVTVVWLKLVKSEDCQDSFIFVVFSFFNGFCCDSAEDKCGELTQSCKRCTSAMQGCSWCDGICVKGDCPGSKVIAVIKILITSVFIE